MAESSELFREMAELTRPRCMSGACGARRPGSCCDDLYCQAAEKMALERGIRLPHQPHPTLRFMGQTGCIVPPEMRPLCTLHDCKINSLGEDPRDPQWTEKYFALRERINEAVHEEWVNAKD